MLTSFFASLSNKSKSEVGARGPRPEARGVHLFAACSWLTHLITHYDLSSTQMLIERKEAQNFVNLLDIRVYLLEDAINVD